MKHQPKQNHYFINESAVLSFSGGRSSAYMLAEILEAHQGTLPDYVKVLFANTGKEMPATYDFIHACEREFSAPIIWLEYSGKKQFKIVDYETANRTGAPFEQLIKDHKYLPNPTVRKCTIELKILTIKRYMEQIGQPEYLTMVGIRGDEPRRAAKQKAKDGYEVPLYDAGVTIETVRDYWDAMPWNLHLPMTPRGNSYYSNCELCFLKGRGIKQSIIRESIADGTNLADWWIEQERKTGNLFRSDQPSYAAMKEYEGAQLNIFDDDSIDCFCGE